MNMNEEKLKLKENMEQQLELRGETLTSIGRAIKVKQNILHSWLTGTLPSGKYLPQVRALADHWSMSVEELLFGEETKSSETLFSSQFKDGPTKYKLVILKMRD